MIDSQPNVYQRVQTEQIASLLAHRNGSAERRLLARMIRDHQIVRRKVSPNLEARQLTFGDQP